MPALTPEQLLPYPIDSDAIDVAGDIERLALELDDNLQDLHVSDETLGARCLALENQMALIWNRVYNLRLHYMHGNHVGPTADMLVWPFMSYTFQTTGVALVHFQTSIFVDTASCLVDTFWLMNTGAHKRQRAWVSPDTSWSYCHADAITVLAGETITMNVQKVYGDGRIWNSDETGIWTGCTIFEGLPVYGWGP